MKGYSPAEAAAYAVAQEATWADVFSGHTPEGQAHIAHVLSTGAEALAAGKAEIGGLMQEGSFPGQLTATDQMIMDCPTSGQVNAGHAANVAAYRAEHVHYANHGHSMRVIGGHELVQDGFGGYAMCDPDSR